MRGPALLLAAVAVALALAGCARKGDPAPPGATPEGPRVVAPSEVTDPIRRGRRL